MRYSFEANALRKLKKLPRDKQRQITKKLRFYFNSPNPYIYAEFLIDRSIGECRFRVGDYRIIGDFDNERKLFIIRKIRHRKDAYR